jgi:SAM-dependent methyltransferase
MRLRNAPGLGRSPERDWQRYGLEDPYFGVYSDPRFKGELAPDVREEFFASGRKEVDGVLARVSDVYPDWKPQRALDYGCGVGRLTLALATRCEWVSGVDTSQGMLAEARTNANVFGVDNVDWIVADHLGTVNDYDFAFSRIVFQHIPPRQGEQIFGAIIKGLRLSGVGAVHFAVAPRDRLAHLYNPVVRHVPLAAAGANLLKGRRWDYPTMQMYCYSIPRLAKILTGCGITTWNAVFEPGATRREYDGVTLIFRKPPA